MIVNQDCSIANQRNIFVIGDAATFKTDDRNILPGITPAAIQQGGYVAKMILSDYTSKNRKPFKYVDIGSMAIIGKAKAIAKIKILEFTEFFAWLP